MKSMDLMRWYCIRRIPRVIWLLLGKYHDLFVTIEKTEMNGKQLILEKQAR